MKDPQVPLDAAILVLDAAGTIVWASAAAVALLGAENLVGVRPWDVPGVAFSVTGGSAGYDGEGGPRMITRSDGSVVDVIWESSKDADGGPVGAVGVLRLRSTGATPGETACLEDAADGTFQLSPDGHFIAVSGSFSELCGYGSPAALRAALPRGVCQLFVEPARYAELMRRLRDSGEATRFEAAILRRDGTTSWVSQNVRAVVDGWGAVRHYAGTVQDIGWRKLAEEILNQAEEKWRAVVEGSGECIVIADRTGTVSFSNRKAQQSGIGLTDEGVLSGFTAPSQQSLRAAVDTAFQTMHAQVLTLDRAAVDGDRRWFEVRVVPIGNVGAMERVILIATDLTSRMQAEEALREGQRLIGRVADASPAILYVYDFPSERYVYVNHQVEKILGYSSEAFLAGGKSLADSLIHPEDAGLVTKRQQHLSEARDDGVVFEYTLRMRHASGHWLWIRARDVVFTRDPEGHPAQIIGMAEDVTERQRAGEERERSREQLRALSARLQEAREEERAAISRRVHDELGQALTALSWEIGKLAGGPQADTTERLAVMSGMVDSMMQIVRKVSAELRPPILDHFGLVAAIEWQAREFQERYRISCEVAARTQRAIQNRAISTAVFRIFQEILTNVARHSGATRVRVQFLDCAGGHALIVQDDGCGITEGQKAQSLGILGMRERALLFGGFIEIRGTPSRGTTVTVHIPEAPTDHGKSTSRLNR